MNCRERLEAYLRENQVPFQVQQHPLAFSAQRVAASEHVPGRQLAKAVMVVADGRMVMLVLTADHLVDLNTAAAALGAQHARLATEREFADRFPDCELGAMPPFGNLYDLPVYVDQAVTRDETIVFRAGSHTETMSVRYADFERLVRPTVAGFARHI